MNAQPWLEQVRAELARRKLPPLYAERLLSELSDHITDFTEDLDMSTDALERRDAVRPMGTALEIADSAAEEYRNRRFAGRHPIAAFVGLPIVLLPILWVAFVCIAVFGVAGATRLAGLQDSHLRGPLPTWGDWSLRLLFQSIVVLPILIAAGLCCRMAGKAGVSWKWPLTACCLLAILGSLAVADMALPTATSQGRFTFGFGISARPHPTQIVQFLLPLAIGLWAIQRHRPGTRRLAA